MRLHPASALLSALVLAPRLASAVDYYVAPSGSDTADGTEGAPWATWAHAQSAMEAGDTAHFRGGTYAYTSGTSTCSSETATINAVQLNKSGSAGKPLSYVAYAGEKPIFDFAGIDDSCRITGIRVTASYVVLRGLEIRGVPQNNTANHESWGIWSSGSNNVFELLDLHDNMGPGLFIADGGNNLVLNCDSHDNFDPNSSSGPGTNADGFGCHIKASGTGNVFRGCRAWYNADDGYDWIHADAVVTIENSWAFLNGYRSGTTDSSGGDGNGFKAGGYGKPPTDVPASPPQHVVENCVAVQNRASGFYANHHPVSNFWYNNTGLNNKSANFNMLGLDGSTDINVGVLRNNVAFTGTAVSNGTGGMIDSQFNSWDSSLGVSVSAADFLSSESTGWDAPRQADGSLPELTSMHLASGSDLIDKGTDVGLPFAGSKPDLGAFEVGLAAAGTGGAGGSSGGRGGAGGAGAASGGSAGAASPGGSGGDASMGGSSNGGATSGDGGSLSTGGTTGDGGAGANGGAGTTGTGGVFMASGGASGSAGRGSATGGRASSTGGTSTTTGGTSNASAATGGSDVAPGEVSDAGGCGCRTAGRDRHASLPVVLVMLGLAALRRRRARRRAA
jgi:MYXO-CTERM domain-containing protein